MKSVTPHGITGLERVKEKLEIYCKKKEAPSEAAVTTVFTAVDISEITSRLTHVERMQITVQTQVYLNMHVCMLLRRRFIFTHYS